MNWLTNWEEAAKHPRRVRGFLFAAFVALGFWVELLAGFIHHSWTEDIGIALVFGSGMSVLIEPFLRKKLAGMQTDRAPTEVFRRQLVVAAIFGAAVAAGFASRSVLVAGLVAGGCVAALAFWA